ncbi:uncharacterized protein isoform X2 [Rhodnius prolixus]
MSRTGPYLLDSVKCDRYYFGDRTEFSIGRAYDSALDIKSKFVSRNQCLIKYSAEKCWVLKDLSSFRSTRINHKPLISEWQTLNNGDIISFVNHTENEYVFYNDSTQIPTAKKRKLSEVIEIVEDGTPPVTDECELRKLNTRLLAEIEKLAQEKNLLNENYQKIAGVLEETQKSLESVEAQKTTLGLKLMDLSSVNDALANQLQCKIEALKDCEMELDRVVSEKSALQEAMEADVADVRNGSHVSVEFNALKEELEAAKKELMIKEGRLNEILAEKDILSTNISDLLEQEFSCSVCSEVMFQATTLQCRHTFCAKCVATWKLKKKECPVCRTRIKTEVGPLVIDSFIDKLAEFLGGEFKKRREDIRLERASSRPGHAVSPYNYQNVRRGRRSRGNGPRTPRRTENPSMRSQGYHIFVNQMQRLLDFTEPLLTIDLTNSPGRLNRR